MGKKLTVALKLTVFLAIPSKPRRLGLRDGDRSLKEELGRLLDRVHVSRKVRVVENEDGLDRIRGGDARVFNHDEVIAVSFFSAFGEVRAAGEYFSGGQVEISDHELVVFVNAGARTEFRGDSAA